MSFHWSVRLGVRNAFLFFLFVFFFFLGVEIRVWFFLCVCVVFVFVFLACTSQYYRADEIANLSDIYWLCIRIRSFFKLLSLFVTSKDVEAVEALPLGGWDCY